MGQLGHGPSGSIVFSPSSQLTTTIQGLSSSVRLFLWDDLISVPHQDLIDKMVRKGRSSHLLSRGDIIVLLVPPVRSCLKSDLALSFVKKILIVGQPLSSPAVRVFVVCVFGTLPDYKLQI